MENVTENGKFPARGLRAMAWMRALLAVALVAALAGCGIFSGGDKQKDEFAGWSAEKLYADAKDEMAHGGWGRAIKVLEQLEARYPFGVYAQQAQMDIAYAYWKDGEPAQALAAADRFIKLHPTHPTVDYMYYLKGLVNFNDTGFFLASFAQQDLSERDPKAARESFDAFKELATRFPDSRYTPDAIERMKYLINALASSEVHIARYYYKRGAYLAAANRAQAAVREYQEAPAIEEALYLMVLSYEAMGMQGLRDDAERILRKNFPQTELLAQGFKQQKSRWWQLW
jgi:outer membrane protein assembly factor BamD